MTSLVRWTYRGERLAVLWWDEPADRFQRTEVEVDHDLEGTTFPHVSGEPLPWELVGELTHDLHCAEDDTGFAPPAKFYSGVEC